MRHLEESLWTEFIVALGLLVWTFLAPIPQAYGAPVVEPAPSIQKPPPARETWANPSTLRDHFERHGHDFKAKDPEDYAAKAWTFLQKARTEGFPAKVDDEGVIRIWDPKTGTFGAYNRAGKTKTLFKPKSHNYFERQPGRSVDLTTRRF